MMLRNFTALVALFAGLAQAQTAEEIAAYPDYAEAFAKWNKTWESFQVHTEDGYILTMWHVTGDTETGPYTETKNSVLFQHGMGGEGLGYIQAGSNAHYPPTLIQLAEQGFDVYLGSNSGIRYSTDHEWLSNLSAEYWAIDWQKFGSIDTPAMVEGIQERNGGGKVALIGHSQGTSQFFAGMGLIPDWYDEHVSIAAMMGPCTSPSQDDFLELYTPESKAFMDEYEIYVLGGGPGWEEQKQRIIDYGPQGLIDEIPTMEGLPNNPVQAIWAYGQTSLTNRFQRYTADFWDYYEENGRYKKTPLMDFGQVNKMQVAFYVGLFDNTCPLTYAQWQHEQLGAAAVHWLVEPWGGHVPWAIYNNPWFVNDMASVLVLNQ